MIRRIVFELRSRPALGLDHLLAEAVGLSAPLIWIVLLTVRAQLPVWLLPVPRFFGQVALGSLRDRDRGVVAACSSVG